MKPLTNPEYFAFTNHFNQSMLKKRIQMMNKNAVTWKTALQYLLFAGAIGLVFSFSKPSLTIDEAEKSKYLHQNQNEFEWVITPKISLGDLAIIQQALKKQDIDFKVSKYVLDNSQNFIKQIETYQIGKGYNSVYTHGNESHKLPFKSKFYKYNPHTNQFSSSLKPSSSTLEKIAKEDEASAKEVFSSRILQYQISELKIKHGMSWDKLLYMSTNSFTQNPFEGIEGTPTYKINTPANEVLKKALENRSALFRQNGFPVSYEYVSKLAPNQIKEFASFVIYDAKNLYKPQSFVLIHTY
ncbi:hypothetical protein P1X15_04920 [Runella sp. MFBS21]|uniref:hypothetical protein n=1 Tax=Runella sp. MFBS21 TaxID=3034018 RepID=UPI0023F83FCF|nr:hypothetical protein [Runella sp. MFBS21]MDF7816922.1 hypothetical protein [Runella sp. MFBS21]